HVAIVEAYAWLHGGEAPARRRPGVVTLPLIGGGEPFGAFQVRLGGGGVGSLRMLALLAELLAASLYRRHRVSAVVHEVRGPRSGLRRQLEHTRRPAADDDAGRWGARASLTLDEADQQLRSLSASQPVPAPEASLSEPSASSMAASSASNRNGFSTK